MGSKMIQELVQPQLPLPSFTIPAQGYTLFGKSADFHTGILVFAFRITSAMAGTCLTS